MPNSSDPNIELNFRPKDIVQTSLLPVAGGIIILVIIVVVWLFRTEPPRNQATPSSPSSVTTNAVPEVTAHWFDDAKYTQMVLTADDTVAPTEEVAQRTDKKRVDAQEARLRQQELESAYALKTELLALEKKNVLDAKALEYAAEKAPLDLKVPLPPAATAGVKSSPSEQSGAGQNLPLPPGASDTNGVQPQDSREAFLHRVEVDPDGYLNSVKRLPLSPYELKAGTYIPAALINGVNSDLPGPVVAQVTANVYDTVKGEYVLIPQGSRLIGEYDSHVSFGQNRALVVWTSLKFPDGSSLDLKRMSGVDVAGYAGFYDKVDNHYLKLYSNALMLSLVGAGYELLNKSAENSNASAGNTVAASVGQRLADVSNQTMERHLSIPPTIEIRPGYRFNVVTVKDIVLEDVTDVP